MMKEILKEYDEIIESIEKLVAKKYVSIRVNMNITDRIRKVWIWSKDDNEDYKNFIDTIRDGININQEGRRVIRFICDKAEKIREYYKNNNMPSWNNLTFIMDQNEKTEIIHHEFELDKLSRDFNVKDANILWEYKYLNRVRKDITECDKNTIELFKKDNLDIIVNEFNLNDVINSSRCYEGFIRNLYMDFNNMNKRYIDEIINDFFYKSRKYFNIYLEYSQGKVDIENYKLQNNALEKGNVTLTINRNYEENLKYAVKSVLNKDINRAVYILWGTGDIIFQYGSSPCVTIDKVKDNIKNVKLSLPLSIIEEFAKSSGEYKYSYNNGDIIITIKWDEIMEHEENLNNLKKRMIKKGLSVKKIENIFNEL